MKILRPQEIYLLRMSGRATLANGGGGGGSSSSEQSSNTTTDFTNTVTNNDTRSVASDHAIALGGSNDSVTQNTTNTDNSTSLDVSNHSTNFSSQSQSGNNSGNTNTNSGNTSFSSSSTVNNTVTDFGSVQKALDAMQATSKGAIGLSGDVAGDAIGALTHQSDSSMLMLSNMFQFAKSSSANSQGTAMDAMGLAGHATEAAQNQAADSKKQMQYILIGGGVLLAILILKK